MWSNDGEVSNIQRKSALCKEPNSPRGKDWRKRWNNLVCSSKIEIRHEGGRHVRSRSGLSLSPLCCCPAWRCSSSNQSSPLLLPQTLISRLIGEAVMSTCSLSLCLRLVTSQPVLAARSCRLVKLFRQIRCKHTGAGQVCAGR
jgi:hypothetical protein